MTPDERYLTINELPQGQRFTYRDEHLMKLPNNVTCYDQPVNAVDINTGTLVYVDSKIFIDSITMKAVPNL